MLYSEFIKINTECPFCEPKKIEEVIKENDHAFMTYSIAPYHKHHVLIIPHRHTEIFDDLNKEETIAIDRLLKVGVKMIRALGYNDYTILVRNGGKNNKSIEHLHYHIVPNVTIGDLEHDNSQRRIMSKEEIFKTIKDFKDLKIEDEL